MDTTTNNQKLLSAPIPFYKTRWFWTIIYSVVFIFGTLSFIFLYENKTIENLIFAFGGGAFYLFGYKLFALIGGIVAVVIYLSLQTGFIFHTFKNSTVNISYPLFLLILYITGFLISNTFLSGM